MAGRLAGKVAIVTGAARGQGAAEARAFVAEGAQVVIGDVLDDEGAALADELGPAAAFEHLDVADEASWERIVATTTACFGPPTVLVNNAGILVFHQLVNTPREDFDRVLAVNLVGPFLGMKAVAGPMSEAGGGSIVNISSTGGLTGMPAVSAYVASKFGLTGLTKSAAMELGPMGIRVNSVHPGSIGTPMTMMGTLEPDDFEPFYGRLPIPRLGTPEDVAPLVVFLASDESSYCTGAEYVVDGGQTCGDHTALG